MFRIRIVLTQIVTIALVATVLAGSLAAQPTEKTAVPERSPLLKEPTTPEAMFAASLLMVDLARLDLAAKYLEQFEETSPDDELLIKLRDKYGTGDFLKLARTKELQPRSMQLLERLNVAAKKQAEDPAFVDALVQRLTQGPTQRDLAIAELRNAGVHVVPEILKQMSQADLAAHQDVMVIALMKMGNQVIPPLIGAFDAPQERVRTAAIDILYELDATEAVPYLWYPAFDENQPAGVRAAANRCLAKLLKSSLERTNQLSSVEAANELRRLAKLLYRSPQALPVDDQGHVALWSWNEELGTVALQSLPPEIASLMVSTRFARQALSLSPEQTEPQRQYLASLLALEVMRNGWDKPRLATPNSAMYLALTAGETMVSQVLAEALEAGQAATAVVSLEVLSQIGSRDLLLTQKGLKSPVLAALNSPDSRVQFAAATTILKLEPKNGFSGVNRVVSILARAASDPGASRVIIIDADSGRASMTAGYLSDGGYEGIVTATGREGFELASTSAGIEFIVVQVNCVRWELTQTLTNLRADARTAALPIVIYGPSSLRGDMARQVARNAPAAFVAESASASDFLGQVLPFIKSLKTPPLSPQERALEKEAAVYWLATIGSGSLGRLLDISQAENDLSAAVEDPTVAKNALVALGGIGTRGAQRRLADVALNSQADEMLREAAANQLAYHIQRFSLLLKRDEVADLQAGWKLTDRPGVKSALASVIGTLKPNATTIGERLRQFPVPPAQ